MRIVSLLQTTGFSPCQWEGLLDDGRSIYIRYRGGRLSAGIGRDIEDAVDGLIAGREPFYMERIGEKYDGRIMEDMMLVFIEQWLSGLTECRDE